MSTRLMTVMQYFTNRGGKLIRGYFVVYEFSKLPCFKETRHYLQSFDWCNKVRGISL